METGRVVMQLDAKWVFKVKYDCQGRIEHLKDDKLQKAMPRSMGLINDETFSLVVQFIHF